MSKKLFLVLGNGFTIDFLKHIGQVDDIDVINLFRRGAEVPWPATGIPGFLSFKHCPNLWTLGARPNMNTEEAMSLIEEIITCVHVYVSRKKLEGIGSHRTTNIYLHAYFELIQYIRHLFAFYDSQMKGRMDDAIEWPWLQFIKQANESPCYSEITIVTYNYDVLLENLLNEFEIPFKVGIVGSDKVGNAKIKILKPHGSISFLHNQKNDKDLYGIKYDQKIQDASIDDLSVGYGDLDDNYLISALIPPAGDSERFKHIWSSPIRAEAKRRVDELSKDDEMIICGLSYWHVDRSELDELFTGCDPSLDVTMVNPNPPRTLDAVLTSMFSNFVTYPNSVTLRNKMKCQII